MQRMSYLLSGFLYETMKYLKIILLKKFRYLFLSSGLKISVISAYGVDFNDY